MIPPSLQLYQRIQLLIQVVIQMSQMCHASLKPVGFCLSEWSATILSFCLIARPVCHVRVGTSGAQMIAIRIFLQNLLSVFVTEIWALSRPLCILMTGFATAILRFAAGFFFFGPPLNICLTSHKIWPYSAVSNPFYKTHTHVCAIYNGCSKRVDSLTFLSTDWRVYGSPKWVRQSSTTSVMKLCHSPMGTGDITDKMLFNIACHKCSMKGQTWPLPVAI